MNKIISTSRPAYRHRHRLRIEKRQRLVAEKCTRNEQKSMNLETKSTHRNRRCWFLVRVFFIWYIITALPIRRFNWHYFVSSHFFYFHLFSGPIVEMKTKASNVFVFRVSIRASATKINKLNNKWLQEEFLCGYYSYTASLDRWTIHQLIELLYFPFISLAASCEPI